MVTRLLAVALLGAAAPAMAALTAKVDHDTVAAGTPLMLTVVHVGDEAAQPDWSALERDFHVAERGLGTDYSVVDGRMTRRRTWSVVLIARRAGRSAVPALRIGDETTTAIPIAVTAPSASDPRPLGIVEISVSPRNPYARQQVHVKTRVLVKSDVIPGSLSELAAPGAVVQGLNAPARSELTRDGVTYDVVERTYVLFPMAPGPLRISPPVFHGKVNLRPGPETPFGTRLPTAGLRPFYAATEERTIRVRRPPVEPWLPAQRLTLTEHLEPPDGPYAAGEPIVRTIELSAEGQLHAQLPALAPPEAAGARVYADAPEGETLAEGAGVSARRETRLTYFPEQPGAVTLPEIRVDWWDVAAGRARVATIAERHLIIGPPPVAPPASAAAAPRPAERTTPPAWPRTAALVGAAAGLGALLGLTIRRRRAAPPTPQQRLRVARRRLDDALRRGEPAAVRAALLHWGRCRHGDRAIVGLHDLAARASPVLRAEIARLDRALYGHEPQWRADALVHALARERLPRPAPVRGRLPPLYPFPENA